MSSTDPSIYLIMIMPHDAMMVNAVIPPIGTWELKLGESMTIEAVAGPGWKFVNWEISDFETSQYPVDWSLPGFKKKKFVSDNPITIRAEGVDGEKYNCTYRTWWYVPHFEKVP
jgi:hypothetical protein